MSKSVEKEWQLRLRAHNTLLIQFSEIAKYAPSSRQELLSLAVRIAALEEQYQQDQIRPDVEREEWIQTTFRGRFEARRNEVQNWQRKLDITVTAEYDSPHALLGVRYKVRK